MATSAQTLRLSPPRPGKSSQAPDTSHHRRPGIWPPARPSTDLVNHLHRYLVARRAVPDVARKRLPRSPFYGCATADTQGGKRRRPHHRFSLPSVERKKITASFDGGRLSSDSGVMLFGLAERRTGIADRLAAEIADRRDPTRVVHTLSDILHARILAIASRSTSASKLSRKP